jgi:hypothetical protein
MSEHTSIRKLSDEELVERFQELKAEGGGDDPIVEDRA